MSWATVEHRDGKWIVTRFGSERRFARISSALRSLYVSPGAWKGIDNLKPNLRGRPSATHCREGHAYSPENVTRWAGHKRCRICAFWQYETRKKAGKLEYRTAYWRDRRRRSAGFPAPRSAVLPSDRG